MSAGYIWVSNVDDLLRYTDSTIVRVVAGGLTCAVDCEAHDQAEDATVYTTNQVINDTGAQVGYDSSDNLPNYVSDDVVDDGTVYSAPHDAGVYVGDDNGANTGAQSGVDFSDNSGANVGEDTSYNSGANSGVDGVNYIAQDSGDDTSANGSNNSGVFGAMSFFP